MTRLMGSLLLISIALGSTLRADEPRRALAYAQAPVDNPLKGLVPYQGDRRAMFPHSLEFNYLPYSDLVKGYDRFDWEPMEKLLNDIAGRGHQAIFRIFLEYPGLPSGIPSFLRDDGLKVTNWLFPENNPPAKIDTPNYEDANLRKSLKNFIAAMGKKYDGDPRIGFITAGLLGAWGEWHTYPRDDLFASKTVQIEVMDAYEAAFKVTPVLLRYPAGEQDNQKAKNAHRPFGYHDDSFAWATLHTGKKGDEWFYMTALKMAGSDALEKWKTQPIGGEIRPEAWGQVFDDKPKNRKIQNFRECVETTHATWLMDTGMFRGKPAAERLQRAKEQVRRLGYEFYCPGVTVGLMNAGHITVQLELENRGVAPFYYDWKAEYALLQDGKDVKSWPSRGKLKGLMPGDQPRLWADRLDVSGIKPGSYTLALRVANPMKTGRPLRFANADQGDTWLSLSSVTVP